MVKAIEGKMPNVNTLLISVLLLLSSWTLKTVTEQSATIASMSERIKNLERVVYSQKAE